MGAFKYITRYMQSYAALDAKFSRRCFLLISNTTSIWYFQNVCPKFKLMREEKIVCKTETSFEKSSKFNCICETVIL